MDESARLTLSSPIAKAAKKTDAVHTPLAQCAFARMARYGRAGLQAVLTIRPRAESA